MKITVTVNQKPETSDQRCERIKAEQRIRSKYITEQVEQEAEDGAGWVLMEAKHKADQEIQRWHAANGVIKTIEEE